MASLDAVVEIPSHVPAELVLPFNPWADMSEKPFEALERARPYGPVVYSPAHHIVGFAPNGGWMVTRAEEARQLLLDTETFSSQYTTGIPQALGETFCLAPIEADPPEHFKTRSLLNPLFSPPAMRQLDGRVRQRASDLIDAALAQGHCEFVHEFAKVLPSEIFLDIFGLPHEDLSQFLSWEEKIMGATDVAVRIEGLQGVSGRLRAEIRARKAEPRDDVLSSVVNSQIDGRELTESEALGTAILLYIAGLDTVVNALGWQLRYLAEHPEDQARLRADPKLIPAAVEELLRAFSIVSLTRRATRDVEFAGVSIRQGDVVSVPTPLASRDPDLFENAGTVDITRNPRRHFAFGVGPHICLGMHLARVELVASVELWLSKVPPFRVARDFKTPTHGGAVLSVEKLPLEWDTPAS